MNGKEELPAASRVKREWMSNFLRPRRVLAWRGNWKRFARIDNDKTVQCVQHIGRGTHVALFITLLR